MWCWTYVITQVNHAFLSLCVTYELTLRIECYIWLTYVLHVLSSNICETYVAQFAVYGNSFTDRHCSPLYTTLNFYWTAFQPYTTVRKYTPLYHWFKNIQYLSTSSFLDGGYLYPLSYADVLYFEWTLVYFYGG